MNDSVSGWFWPLFPLLFVGLFCAVSWILATAGGWRRLADAYPDDAPVEGTTFRWQSAQFGSANYGGCLTVTADPSRLRLTVLLPFRLLGIGVEAVFELLRAIVMLPARVLGGGVGR